MKYLFSKSCDSAAPDGLSSSFLNYGAEVLTSELTKLLGLIWAKNESPSNSCESVTAPINGKKVVDPYMKATKILV